MRADEIPAELADRAAALVVGILGGTGNQGRGLALRLARAGNRVIIGSRDPDRARAAAASIGDPPQVTGAGNEDAAAGAILPETTVVGAFHHVSAVLLLDPDVASLDQDVMVVGDDRAATDLVQALAARLPGVRGVYAGRLRNCGQVEALTANLNSVNRRYKAHAGIRVTDI